MIGRQTCGLSSTHEQLRTGTRALPPCEVTAVDGSLVLSQTLPLLGKRYKFIRNVGHGTFSQILLCKDTYAVDSDDQPRPGCAQVVAIKVMNRKYGAIGVQELEMLRFLNSRDTGDCAHLARVVSAFDFYGHFCIVMKRLGSSLLALQRNWSTPRSLLPSVAPHAFLAPLRKLSVQVLSSLLYLERSGVIHADIKPENILSDDLRDRHDCPTGSDLKASMEHATLRAGRFRLIDFGNSMLCENAPMYYDDFEVQSLCYRAPEVLLGLPFGPPIDMWSFGCVLAELVTGSALFIGKNRRELLTKMANLLGPLPVAVFAKAKFFPVFNAEEPGQFSRVDLDNTPGGKDIWELRRAKLKEHLGTKDMPLVDFLDRSVCHCTVTVVQLFRPSMSQVLAV